MFRFVRATLFHLIRAVFNTIGGAVPLSEVVPDFATSLDQLRGIIAEHLSTAHTFAGKDIAGGVRLNDIVAGLCESVNRTDAICPPRFAVHQNVCVKAKVPEILIHECTPLQKSFLCCLLSFSSR